MNCFVRVVLCFVVAAVACVVYAADKEVRASELSDALVDSYKQAFEAYQVKFDKHYETQEEYEKRLRAYAVCDSFALSIYSLVSFVVCLFVCLFVCVWV